MYRREEITREKRGLGNTEINTIGREIVLKEHGDQREQDGCGDPQLNRKYGNTFYLLLQTWLIVRSLIYCDSNF